ncbi:MAG: GGDEF domain-containing protein [Arcobacter sp.]|uniref:GGDEF domain-containing protein n=1 Tax=Arcobacter sp. TaxID=1872629 RepID=UPI003B001733
MNNTINLNQFQVFHWNKNFEIGIKEIDEQHKQLINLLNKLANTLTYENDAMVTNIFKELADYATYHFETEEKIWSKYLHNDKWYIKHQSTHKSFLPKVLKLQAKSNQQNYNQIIEETIMFLIRWLAIHIIDEDKKMFYIIKYIKKNKTIKEAKKLTKNKMNDSIKMLTDTILNMHESISSRTITLMKEHNARIKAEEELKKANEELLKLSITDQLTQLYNRRHFENVFKSELSRAKRTKIYLTIISFDIDYFKRHNDYYGHVKGDDTLRKVGESLKSICKRSHDFPFRIGGEEFAILTSVDNEELGLKLAQSIQKSIDDLNIENIKSDVSKNLTVSMGILSKIPTQEDTIENLMKIVDKKLYKAKQSGRNKIVK